MDFSSNIRCNLKAQSISYLFVKLNFNYIKKTEYNFEQVLFKELLDIFYFNHLHNKLSYNIHGYNVLTIRGHMHTVNYKILFKVLSTIKI